MVGHRTMIKPSRSDEVLDADQQLQISNQVRAHFDSVAPKRTTKPNRSESDSTPESSICTENFSVPEFQKFQSLQSQSQVMFTDPNTLEQEEFVETRYYTELDSIDKQHYAVQYLFSSFFLVVQDLYI
ncbi:unnamed protein product [Ilex paraguariensis]|uniref:Uncharacterized protein n=1 Tax=Ilex paraguariensis TaxID=185542 RepID=A0ABC8QUF2_9AQUA